MTTPVSGEYWSNGIHDVVLSPSLTSEKPFKIIGGAENAAFIQIVDISSEKLTYLRGDERLQEGEIILELQNEKVSGKTSYDVQALIDENCRRGVPIFLKTVKPGFLSTDLRSYLSLRFPQGSLDHDLQNTVRDNIYTKTVPCTTRERREGEVDGHVYRFISKEEFGALERNGELLESGIYEGNYYGTPKPPKVEEYELDAVCDPVEESSRNVVESLIENSERDQIMPPLFTSDTKTIPSNTDSSLADQHHLPPPSTSANTAGTYNEDDGLGPMPPNWEIGFTESGEKYFIDHNHGTTQWTDPRRESSHIPDTSSEPLPSGWDRVEDPQYGVYYVDHINKVTQYEKPTVVQGGHGTVQRQYSNKRPSKPRRVNSANDLVRKSTTESPHKGLFTLNPRELRGEMLTTTLIKGPKGLGFTLVGNDGNAASEEFLQIRNVIPDGPADKDGRLRMGDILVYVNNTCVLGYTQYDIVRIFQSVNVADPVTLCVCRGYPLLFDPANVTGGDIITQDAYSIIGSDHSSSPFASDLSSARAETVVLRIVKGDMGFGFTISDSPYGQKVKKILDKPRCRGLVENDVLCQINDDNVRKMNHAKIVEVLNDCPVGKEAVLHVQRSFGTIKRSQTDIPATILKPPSVPAKPAQRPHSYHPSYNGNGEGERRSKTPTAELSRHYSEHAGPSSPATGNVPVVRPRSKTPGPVPSRSQKPNGFVTNGGSHYAQRYEHAGVPIYENLPGQVRYGDPASISPTTGRPKTPSLSSAFASATPNYVPASVYSSHYTGSNGKNTMAQDTPTFVNTTYADGYEYMNVNLIRQQNGFGFRVVGGTEERTQTAVGQIVPGGAADTDRRLKMGDEIVEIDGLPMIGAYHQDAVRAMNAASQNGYVKLVVRRRNTSPVVPTGPSQSSAYYPVNKSVDSSYSKVYPYDVTIVRNDSEGFGFQIVSSVHRSGSCIGKIIEGSPAARCMNLRVNDRIIKINGFDILPLHHGDIVNLIKHSGNVVKLTVGSPEENPLPSSTTIVNSSSIAPIPREMTASERTNSKSCFAVELQRGSKGFGFSIRGGQEFDNMPLLVLRIAEGGPAYNDGMLKVGDQLVEINGVSTVGMMHAEAIELIKRGPTVRLLVKRQADSPSELLNTVSENPYGHLASHSTSNAHISTPTSSSWPVVR